MSKTRVALYARVSTDMQADKALAIPAQINEMKEYAAARGWEIVFEFVDAGFSGTSMDRPGLETAIEAAQAKSYDILLVHELSRLSRSIFDTFNIFDILGKLDIGFASVKEPNFDFSTTGRFFLTIMAAINQYYVDMLRMHVAKAKRQRAREGLYNASRLPYGYLPSPDPKTPPVIDPEAGRAVKLAFETYTDGKHSFQDVADRLNQEGFRTASGRKFTGASIDEMLHNRFYTGLVIYGVRKKGQLPEVFPGQHEAIVSTELFEQVQAVQKQRYVGSRTFQAHWRVYLLNGIIHCDACGRRLRSQTTKTGSYYREVSKARGYFDCPDAMLGARADIVAKQIEVLIRDMELPDDWLDQLEGLLKDQEEVVSLENQRGRLQAEQRRLRELYKRGYYDDDMEAFERDAQALQRQIDRLPGPQDMENIRDAAYTLTNMAEIWDEATPEEQRDMLRLAVAEVYTDVRQNRITSLRPHPPFRPLFQQLNTLVEVEPGRFAPIFPPDVAATLGIESPLPELTLKTLPIGPVPVWPLVMTLPPNLEGDRISPVLSSALKVQRKVEVICQHIVDVPCPGFPALQIDPRKWPGGVVETYNWTGDAPPHFSLQDGSVTFLHTPFVYQTRPFKIDWLDEAERVLAVGGRWWLYDVMPHDMPGFWLFRFFPAAFRLACAAAQHVHKLYLALQERGWSVTLKRQAYYQAVSVGAALEIARARDKTTWLADLLQKEYEEGVRRLQDIAGEKGTDSLLPSHICVAESVIERKV